MADLKFSTIYDHHDGPEINDFGPSRAKQEFREEADINHIMEEYKTTGFLPGLREAEAVYGDFTNPELTNYQDAMNIVLSANELFAQLPPRVRERFANDPVNLILFVQDGNNRKEAIELGILQPEKAEPAPTPPTDTAKP